MAAVGNESYSPYSRAYSATPSRVAITHKQSEANFTSSKPDPTASPANSNKGGYPHSRGKISNPVIPVMIPKGPTKSTPEPSSHSLDSIATAPLSGSFDSQPLHHETPDTSPEKAKSDKPVIPTLHSVQSRDFRAKMKKLNRQPGPTIPKHPRTVGSSHIWEGVSLEVFSEWDSGHETFITDDRKASSFDYDSKLGRLIVKTNEGPIHDGIVGVFELEMAKNIEKHQLRRRVKTGTTKAITLADGKRKKSADLVVTPIRTSNKRKDTSTGYSCPSIVLEVAFSQTSKSLRKDARRWLLRSDRKVKAVVAIKVTETKLSTDPRIRQAGGKSAVEKLSGDQWIEWKQNPDTLAEFHKNNLKLRDLILDHYKDGTLWLDNGPLIGEMTATFYVYRRRADGKAVEDVFQSVFWSSNPSLNPKTCKICEEITTADLVGDEGLQDVPILPCPIHLEELQVMMPDHVEEYKEWKAELAVVRILEKHNIELGPYEPLSESADEDEDIPTSSEEELGESQDSIFGPVKLSEANVYRDVETRSRSSKRIKSQ